jgi:4-amino-4-deoxy-L-arabinose transferase-like glycosyltransferase
MQMPARARANALRDAGNAQALAAHAGGQAAGQIAQSIAGAVGVILIAVAAFRLGGAGSAKAAAAIAAVYPPLIWVAGYAYSEAVFWPAGLTLALVMSRALESPPGKAWWRAILFGVIAGLSILLRAATLLFVPLAGLWLLWKRRWIPLAGLVIGLVVVLTPWTIRNFNFYGHFVLVASDGGVTFWTGNNSLAIGEGDMAANPHLKYANQELRAKHPHLNEEQMEPVYYAESLGWMRAHPGDWLWLMMKKVFYLVVPIGPSYTLHSARYYVLTWVSYGLVLAFALVGFGKLGSRVSHVPGLWMLAGSAVLVCLVFFPQDRFRIPIIDPVLVIVAGAGIAALGSRERRL